MSDLSESSEQSGPPKTKNRLYEIRWPYDPADYFKEGIQETLLDSPVSIHNGTATAQIPPEIYEQSPGLHNKLHRLIDSRFQVQRFRTNRTYTLGHGELTTHHWDGNRIRNITAVVNCTSSVSVDFQITGGDGQLVFDSSAERTKEKLAFENRKKELIGLDSQIAACIERFYSTHSTETIVDSLLASHYAARDNPEDELVYLYELRDALREKFGGEKSARAALGISDSEWSRFGLLANNMPITQGRHRGKFPGEVRPATDEELLDARLFARRLLLGYFQYLDRPKR